MKPEPFGELREKSILFMCDNWGLVVHESPPFRNENGLTVKSYVFVPQELLTTTYPQIMEPQERKYDTKYGQAIKRNYPIDLIDDSNPSRSNAIVRIMCTFDGKDIPGKDREEQLRETVMYYRKYNDRLKIQIAVLEKENKRLVDKLDAYIETQSKLLMRRGGKVDKSEGDEEEDTE